VSVLIADSARWVGDSASAVSMRRLCASARVTLRHRRSPRWAVPAISMVYGRV